MNYPLLPILEGALTATVGETQWVNLETTGEEFITCQGRWGEDFTVPDKV